MFRLQQNIYLFIFISYYIYFILSSYLFIFLAVLKFWLLHGVSRALLNLRGSMVSPPQMVSPGVNGPPNTPPPLNMPLSIRQKRLCRNVYKPKSVSRQNCREENQLFRAFPRSRMPMSRVQLPIYVPVSL